MNGRKEFFVTESREVIDLLDKSEGKIDVVNVAHRCGEKFFPPNKYVSSSSVLKGDADTALAQSL